MSAPIVITQDASDITTTGARLNGTVDPNGSDTLLEWEWGTTTDYGNTTLVQSIASSGLGRETFELTSSFTAGLYPLSDADALARVVAVPEGATTAAGNVSPTGTPNLQRAGAGSGIVSDGDLSELQNASGLGPNACYPTNTQLATFYAGVNNVNSIDSLIFPNAYWLKVTGQPYGSPVPGARSGNNFTLDTPLTTDELIQWAYQKWGLPTVLGRANAAWESEWLMTNMGAYHSTGSADYDTANWTASPHFARATSGDSPGRAAGMGLSQMNVGTSGTHSGSSWGLPRTVTDPLSYMSTAWNLDFWCATQRLFYDNPPGAGGSSIGWALKRCNNNAGGAGSGGAQDYITGESQGNAGGSILNATDAQLAITGGAWYAGGYFAYGPTTAYWTATNGILYYITSVQLQASATEFPGFGTGPSNAWDAWQSAPPPSPVSPPVIT